jgi:hypothetical protein
MSARRFKIDAKEVSNFDLRHIVNNELRPEVSLHHSRVDKYLVVLQRVVCVAGPLNSAISRVHLDAGQLG